MKNQAAKFSQNNKNKAFQSLEKKKKDKKQMFEKRKIMVLMFYRLSEHETHFNFLTKFKFYPKLGKLGKISFKRLKNKFSIFYTSLLSFLLALFCSISPYPYSLN